MKNTNKLVCKWDNKNDAPTYLFPNAEHGRMLNKCFKAKIYSKLNLFEQLEEKGYDLKTFKFEITLNKKKEEE